MICRNCGKELTDINDDFVRGKCLKECIAKPTISKMESVEKIIPPIIKKSEKEIKDKTSEERQKILESKLAEFYRKHVLLNQVFIREPEKTIQEYLNEITARIGEKITVRRFIRWELGS